LTSKRTAAHRERATVKSSPPRAFGAPQRGPASVEAVLKMMTSEQRPAPTKTAMAAAARSSFMCMLPVWPHS
jgi:hypothetical protein